MICASSMNWEYQILSLSKDSLVKLDATLKEQGQLQWELIAVVPFEGLLRHYFKRPVK